MIIITGGHLTPALSLIDELHRRHFTDIVFIGRHLGQEEPLITAKGIRFIPLTAGKLYRHFSFSAIISFLTIPVGLVQSWVILRRLRPRLIVSFGGYIALPVCLAARSLHIPIITHEQGTRVGLANRIIGWIARRVAISWTPTRSAFPARKTLLTGNLLRSAIVYRRTESPIDRPLRQLANRPLIYVTGGNQGSRVINQTLLALLPQLTKAYVIVHQTGSADFNQFSALKLRHYFPFSWLDDEQVSWCFHHASLIISRAGANTVTELAFTGTPAILIPLPKSQQNEQWHNANLLTAAGTARILFQAELTPLKLNREIDFILSHQSRFRRHAAAARRLVHARAAGLLADLIYDQKILPD